MYHGDIRLGDTIDIKFTTRQFSTGAPFALSGGTVVAYPSNSTTEISAGITLSADFDGVTGLNNVRVVATSGNGYATATNYTLVISAGTVDTVSVVGECIGSFSIEARSAIMPTVAARTLDVTATGAAGIDWGNIENPTTAQNLSATNIDVDQIVASVSGAVGSVTGAVGSVTGNVGGNVVGSVGSVAAGGITAASIATDAIDADALAADAVAEIQSGLATSAEVAAVQADTDNIQTRLPAALVGGRMDSSVGAMAADTITAAAIATDAIDADALAADAVAEIQSGLATLVSVAAVLADTDDIQTRLPAALVGGRIDASVGAIAANAITAASIATGAIDADALAQDAAQEIADEVLNRDIAGGGSGNTRNVRNALRGLRNRVDDVAGTITVYQEDDATPAWTAAVTRTAGADPITQIDPA